MPTNPPRVSSRFAVSRLVALPSVSIVALLLGGCFTPDETLDTDSAPTMETDDEAGTAGGSMTTTGTAETSAGPSSSTSMGTTSGMDPTGGMATGDVSTTTTDPETSSSSESESESESESGSESSGTSMGATCMGECIDLGAGWNGPVRLSEGTTTPECEDAEAPAFTAFSGLNAPAAECECSCGSPNVACPETGTITNRGDPGPSCFVFVPPVWEEDVAPGCNDIPNALDLSVLLMRADQPPNIDAGSCAPSASTDVTAAAWDTAWAGCGADAAVGDCEVCSTNTEDMCIWQEGDVECDVPGFAEKTVLFSDFTDDRECSACTCGGVDGLCRADVTYRALDGCTLAVAGEGSSGDCVQAEFARGAEVDFFDTLACEAAAVDAIGSATPTGAITTCCAG